MRESYELRVMNDEERSRLLQFSNPHVSAASDADGFRGDFDGVGADDFGHDNPSSRGERVVGRRGGKFDGAALQRDLHLAVAGSCGPES